MAGDFAERMSALVDQVGPGQIEAGVVVDQVYAKYQELREDLRHPGGGEAHALQNALYEQQSQVFGAMAEALVTPDGSEIRRGAEEAAEKVAAGYYDRAPFEFGDLKASPHPTVVDNGETVYDRAPMIHRLTESELRAKGDLRRLGFGNASGDALRAALDAT